MIINTVGNGGAGNCTQLVSSAAIVQFYGGGPLPAELHLILPYLTSLYFLMRNHTEVESLVLEVGAVTSLQSFVQGCTSLISITPPLNMSNCVSTSSAFASCGALVTVGFVPSTIKISLSLNGSPLLNATSLLSVANGLDATSAPKTLTMHTTSKTNMDALMVDNVGGVAVAGSAMSLTAFITNIKGWTVA